MADAQDGGHIQAVCERRSRPEAALALSRSRFRCRSVPASPLDTATRTAHAFGYITGYKVLQRIYKSVVMPNSEWRSLIRKQVRRPAVLQRLLDQPPPASIRQPVWRKERQGHDVRHGRIVRLFSLSFASVADPPMRRLTGAGEVVLLPLDVLKIMRQSVMTPLFTTFCSSTGRNRTNESAFRNRGFVRIVLDENVRLYRGITWTIARNVPGSFCVSACASDEEV